MSEKMLLLVFGQGGMPIEMIVTEHTDVCPHCWYSGGGHEVSGWYQGERHVGLRCVGCGFTVLAFYYDNETWLRESRATAGNWQSDS